MNVQLNEKHLAIINECNENSIRYLVRNDYKWATPKQPLPLQTLDLWVDAPVSPEEYKLCCKVLGNGGRTISHWSGLFNPFLSQMPTDEFNQAYKNRIIANYHGLKINLDKHASIYEWEIANHNHKINLDYKDNLFTIHSLNFYNVAYLLIDEYPINNPIGSYNSSNSLVVWVNPTEENAKKFRKASDYFSGNPPTVKEMTTTTRRYMQGADYFQTYYKGLNFETIYKKRKIINYKGVEVNFAVL
jgi:hypothetical protein